MELTKESIHRLIKVDWKIKKWKEQGMFRNINVFKNLQKNDTTKKQSLRNYP